MIALTVLAIWLGVGFIMLLGVHLLGRRVNAKYGWPGLSFGESAIIVVGWPVFFLLFIWQGLKRLFGI